MTAAADTASDEDTGFLPGRFCWGELDQDRAAVLWAELVDWTTWLRETYEIHQKVLPCWFAHPAVREELTALMAAHKAAYSDRGEDAPYWSDMAAWHTQYLHPFISRVVSMFDDSECRAGRCGYTPPTVDTLDSIHEYIAADLDDRDAAAESDKPTGLVEVLDPKALRAAINAGDATLVDPSDPLSDVELDGRWWSFDTARNAYTPSTTPPE